MVSVTDKQWEKWGRSGGWTAWEPDTQPQHFFRNLAMVVCKGAFYDAKDPEMQTKVGHFISIARVPDCVPLLPFEQLREEFNSYTDAATVIRLVRLHRGNTLFPDVYFQFYGEHFTIMGLQDPTIQFGTADEFAGGYLVRRHVTASGRKAHAMLPPGYMCEGPRVLYPPPHIHTGPVVLAFRANNHRSMSSTWPQWGRSCRVRRGSASGRPRPLNGRLKTFQYPGSFRRATVIPTALHRTFRAMTTKLKIPMVRSPAPRRMGLLPSVEGDQENDDDDEGFETVDDGDEDTGDKVTAKNSRKDLVKPEGSGLTGADRLFDSDDEEDDAELKEQIEAACKTTDIIEELKLSETSSSSDSGSSDTDDEDADPDAAKERPENPDVEKTKKPGPATVTDTPAEPAGSGNPGDPESEVMPGQNPSKTPGAKGKGPSSGNSGKALASRAKLSAAAKGVRERAQTMLFGGAALAQATVGSEEEEEMTHRLENYTGLLDGFQKLVGIMANGYEDATEDIRCLVASTLDAATERDRTFVAGASQALAKWTTTYQEAMSQGECGSVPEQLARWDRVREAGVALSRQVTSLTTARDPSTTLGEIFQRLLPACFDRVRFWNEATFSALNANLPSLLCRFVRPDQAGQIFSSIFTCMCNYNTEVCRMAMAQTVVPVYTIPNTYRVQQSLWESLCWIIPGIARTEATPGAGGSDDPRTTAMQGDSQPASAPQTSHKKRASREKAAGRGSARNSSSRVRMGSQLGVPEPTSPQPNRG